MLLDLHVLFIMNYFYVCGMTNILNLMVLPLLSHAFSHFCSNESSSNHIIRDHCLCLTCVMGASRVDAFWTLFYKGFRINGFHLMGMGVSFDYPHLCNFLVDGVTPIKALM